MSTKARIRTFCLSKGGLVTATLLLAGGWWLGCLPAPLFGDPLSTELLDRNGTLLSARIARDGQWRLPEPDSISDRLRSCVVTFEDRRFYRHPGIDLRAVLRAVGENYRAGRVVSGGSTLSMQVARMARGNRARTLVQKLLEGAVALRLELSYGKSEILDLWLNHAPFGGNVVGVAAACRRYYGRSPAGLSWAEAATLAVLPNSPALIHPGRSRAALRRKRDALLRQLYTDGVVGEDELQLALLEPLPGAPLAMPGLAPHLLERLRAEGGDDRYRSSVDAELQAEVNRLVREHHRRLAANGVQNAAVLVSEVATARVIAYAGNVPGLAGDHAPDVDLITAARSPGSLLKPILYGLSLEDGSLLPAQLLPDVPTSFQRFRPANFHRDFDGAVAADRALARSLNVPFVYRLRDYRVPRFHTALRKFGFTGMTELPEHYGLSLILGGAEISMEEIHTWFLGMARQQRYYYDRQGLYAGADFTPPSLLAADRRATDRNLSKQSGPVGAGAGYLTLEALRELERPDESGSYRRFTSHRPVAWKTGTSFGYRDAWAVGATPAFVVSVWTGNADGEGRAGLVGVRSAAPLLFDVFRLLEGRSAEAPRWFEVPYDDLRRVRTCRESGFLAGPDCAGDTTWVTVNGTRAEVCPYHQRVLLTADGRFRTRLDCAAAGAVTPAASWFVLPSRQAHFYRKRHPGYRSIPPWSDDCQQWDASRAAMQMVYPEGNGVLSQALDWEGRAVPLTFEVAHRDPDATVYWHLDQRFLTETRTFHHLAVTATAGRHVLSLVDAAGNRLEYPFRVN